MTSSVFPLRLSETDKYLLRRLALERHVSANTLVAELVRAELDRALPGAREAYENREQIAEQVLRRRGIDPASPEYQSATRHARSVLDQVDRRSSSGQSA